MWLSIPFFLYLNWKCLNLCCGQAHWEIEKGKLEEILNFFNLNTKEGIDEGGGTSLICGDFCNFAGGLCFIFNFELGQWYFASRQPYTKSNWKIFFKSLFWLQVPLRHPQSQPPGAWQVGYPWSKMNIWNMFHEQFLRRKRSGWVPKWSEGSRTPSATSTCSTMGSTASIIYIHKKELLDM